MATNPPPIPQEARQVVAVETGAVSGFNVPGYYYVDTREGAEEKLLFQPTTPSDVYSRTTEGVPTSGKFFGKGAGGPEGRVTIERTVPVTTTTSEQIENIIYTTTTTTETISGQEIRTAEEFDPYSRIAQFYGADTRQEVGEYESPGIGPVRRAIDSALLQQEAEGDFITVTTIDKTQPGNQLLPGLAPGPAAVEKIFGDRSIYRKLGEFGDYWTDKVTGDMSLIDVKTGDLDFTPGTGGALVQQFEYPFGRYGELGVQGLSLVPVMVTETARLGLDLAAGVVDVTATTFSGDWMAAPPIGAGADRAGDLIKKEAVDVFAVGGALWAQGKADPYGLGAVGLGSVVGTGGAIVAAPKSVRPGLIWSIQPGEEILTAVLTKVLPDEWIAKIPGKTADFEEITAAVVLGEAPATIFPKSGGPEMVVSKLPPSKFAGLETRITVTSEQAQAYSDLEGKIEEGDFRVGTKDDPLWFGGPFLLVAISKASEKKFDFELPESVLDFSGTDATFSKTKTVQTLKDRPISEIFFEEQQTQEQQFKQEFLIGKAEQKTAFDVEQETRQDQRLDIETAFEIKTETRQDQRLKTEEKIDFAVETREMVFELPGRTEFDIMTRETTFTEQKLEVPPRETETEIVVETEVESKFESRLLKKQKGSIDQQIERMQDPGWTKELNFNVGDVDVGFKKLNLNLKRGVEFKGGK